MIILLETTQFKLFSYAFDFRVYYKVLILLITPLLINRIRAIRLNQLLNTSMICLETHIMMKQSRDKYKSLSSVRQYLKLKPIKCDFKRWFCCASSTCLLYKFDLYLGKKKNVEVNLLFHN